MACPFFLPTERMDSPQWPHPARLPLGDSWSGLCTASEIRGKQHTPGGNELKHGCNLGYACNCPHLPVERHADAVRFSIVRNRDRQINVQFVLEIAHAPGDYGRLAYDPVSNKWLNRHPDMRVQRMAECHLESHLRRYPQS